MSRMDNRDEPPVRTCAPERIWNPGRERPMAPSIRKHPATEMARVLWMNLAIRFVEGSEPFVHRFPVSDVGIFLLRAVVLIRLTRFRRPPLLGET